MPVFSIRRKMVMLVVIVIIPLLFLEITWLNNDFQDKVSLEIKAGEDLANSITSYFNYYIENAWDRQATTGSSFISDRISQNDIQKFLIYTKLKSSPIESISWISMDGTVIASQNPELIGTSVSDSDYFKMISSGEYEVISNFFVSGPESGPRLIIARGIVSDGVVKGIVAGQINPRILSDKLKMSSHAYSRNFGLIDRKGNTVYLTNYSNIGSPGDKNIEYPIGLMGWKCFVSVNYDTITENYRAHMVSNITILILVTMISVLLALIMARKILEPLENIKETISAVKKGDYTVRSNIYGNDELAATAQEIDTMVDTIFVNDMLKSQSFTDMSHELKAPLNVIFASAQLIESISPEQCSCESHNKVLKYVSSIKHNCYKLLKIISNLLDVSKYENGYLTPKMQNQNIISIVEDTTMSVVTYAESKGISVVFDTDTEEKFTACDLQMIERIILNLLSNALKFTDKGGNISVCITSTVDRIIIKVDDTGIGIPQDRIKLIFDRFRQADSSLNRNHYGSGLGLALVKSLVEAHNGTIYVSSEPGKGTSFIIHLPIMKMPEPDNVSETETAPVNDSQNLTRRVIIELSDINDII